MVWPKILINFFYYNIIMHISVPGVRLRGWLFNLLQETSDWTHRYHIQIIMWMYLVSGRSAFLKNLSIMMFALTSSS